MALAITSNPIKRHQSRVTERDLNFPTHFQAIRTWLTTTPNLSGLSLPPIVHKFLSRQLPEQLTPNQAAAKVGSRRTGDDGNLHGTKL